MELRHLRYFVGVAEDGGFSRAATRLRVAQPALSRQIRQLEEEIGVALLERKSSGVRLTRAGEGFLAEARAILERSEAAIRAAQSGEPRPPSVLKVAYVWGLFHSTVPAWLGRFRRGHPDVAVHLLDLTATEQASALVEGTVDVGFIGFEEEAVSAGLSTRKVASCRFQVALPRPHPAARQRRIELSSLAGELFVVISEQTYPGAARWVREACSAAGFRPRILQSAERGHTILGLVAGGCGVALLPETLRALPHPGVVFRPLEQSPEIPLHLAWNPKREQAERDGLLGEWGEGEKGLRL